MIKSKLSTTVTSLDIFSPFNNEPLTCFLFCSRGSAKNNTSKHEGLKVTGMFNQLPTFLSNVTKSCRNPEKKTHSNKQEGKELENVH